MNTIIALIGASAWLPEIIRFLKRGKLFGKIISRYANYNDTHTLFLFRLSVLFKNKAFSPKEIKCEIEYADGQKFSGIAGNKRLIFFKNTVLDKIEDNKPIFIEKQQKLMVQGREFLNNLANFEKDKDINGYVIFNFENVKKETSIVKTTFIFKSFDGKEKKLSFHEKDIDLNQLFYDDSIWE